MQESYPDARCHCCGRREIVLDLIQWEFDFPDKATIMNTCPFCRIATAQPGSASILESDLALAFLDIRPIRPGHVLIVPRRHEPDFWNLTTEEQNEMMALARQVAEAQRKLFNPVKIGLLVAGFEVPHAHLHVAPLQEVHDLTSESILNGTIQFAPADALAEQKNRFAEHFAAQR